MTGFYPNYIWMATNGSANLNPIIMEPLLHRNIILYPDLGQFDKWNEKAEELRKQDFKITASNLLENNATPEDHKKGLDIADYFITQFTNEEVSERGFSPPLGEMSVGQRGLALSKDNTLFNSLTSKYPTIIHLVDVLSLINPKTNKVFLNVN